MKKLESLSAFAQRGMTANEMYNVKGGNAGAESTLESATETGKGTICVPTSLSASGCCAVSSDYYRSDGSYSYSPANGTTANSDVNLPC
jgi:hypothetical protein